MYETTKTLAEGMEAALDGVLLRRCPYRPGSIKRAIWIQGWHNANGTEEGSDKRSPPSDGPEKA